MRRNQKPDHINDPWYILAVPTGTGKSDFGARNCPVRALSYYHRYITVHPKLRKGRCRLFVITITPEKSSVQPISSWICTSLVDSHVALAKSKTITGTVKAQEGGCTVATSLQLFNEVDLQAVMKAGRWMHLRVLLPQRPLLAS